MPVPPHAERCSLIEWNLTLAMGGGMAFEEQADEDLLEAIPAVQGDPAAEDTEIGRRVLELATEVMVAIAEDQQVERDEILEQGRDWSAICTAEDSAPVLAKAESDAARGRPALWEPLGGEDLGRVLAGIILGCSESEHIWAGLTELSMKHMMRQ